MHLKLDFTEPDKPTVWQMAAGTSVNDSDLAILREARFKLVHFNVGLPLLLYNMQADRYEMRNLAGDPATLLRLTRKLLGHRMSRADRTMTR